MIARHLPLGVVALVLVAIAARGSAVTAASFTVDYRFDAADASPGDGVCATAAGACTLRAAVMEANALPGRDVVNVPAGTHTLTIEQEPPAGENTASSGDLNITDDLEIRGVGANQSLIDGGKFTGSIIQHVFEITDASVDILDVTIQNGGWPLSPGGRIYNIGGTLTLSDVIVSGNRGGRGGGVANHGTLRVIGGAFIENGGTGEDGAIFNGGTMTLEGATFRDNFAQFGGGAIGNHHRSTVNYVTVEGNKTVGASAGIYNAFEMTLSNSTVKENLGGSGTGVFNESGATLAVINSTISGNEGRAIYNVGSLSLMNSTVTGNTGLGLFNDNKPLPPAGIPPPGLAVTVGGTILAGNGGSCGDSNPNLESTVSVGHNLSSDGTCPFTAAGDMTNTDPLLGPLADNGGPTQTHALLAGSPAIDAGDNAGCPATDQRGVERPLDGDADGTAVCDIGAYEAPGAPAGTPSPTPGLPTPVATETPSPTLAPPTTPPSSPSTALPAAFPQTGGRPGADEPRILMALGAVVAAAMVSGVAGRCGLARRLGADGRFALAPPAAVRACSHGAWGGERQTPEWM